MESRAVKLLLNLSSFGHLKLWWTKNGGHNFHNLKIILNKDRPLDYPESLGRNKEGMEEGIICFVYPQERKALNPWNTLFNDTLYKRINEILGFCLSASRL